MALDFAKLVPLALQAANGYRTGETDKVIADAALSIAADRNVLRLRISSLMLSERTGRNKHTCTQAMRRLSWLFAPVDEPDARERTSPLYDVLVWSLPGARVDRHDHNICRSTRAPDDHTIYVDLRAQFSELAARDSMARSLSALTPDELAERNERRAAMGLPPMKPTRELRNRLDAPVSAPGPAVALMIDALSRYGALSRRDLEVVTFKSRGAVYRAVTKGLDAGLLAEDDDGLITLADDLGQRIDELDELAPTAGAGRRRKLAALDSRIRYLQAAMADARRTPEQLKNLSLRYEKARAAKLELLKPDIDAHNARRTAAGIKPVSLDVALKPGASFWETKAYQDRRAIDRRDAQADLRELARQLEGLSRDEAMHVGAMAGFTVAEIQQALSFRGVA